MTAATNPMRYFIEPFDVLFLRGNRLFGDPGSFGESVMPPWPSVAAGALRSALLAHRGIDAAAFARGKITSDTELGTPACPGTFALTGFSLARRYAGPDGCCVETLHPIPADLTVQATHDGAVEARRITPHGGADGIESSAATERLAVLAEPERSKPVSGQWMNAEGWNVHLAGRAIDAQRHLVSSRELWAVDTRIGIALDPAQRKAADGALFTSQAVALHKREHPPAEHGIHDRAQSFDVGFLAEVTGATLPNALTLRFGGDGRAAQATLVSASDATHPHWDAITPPTEGASASTGGEAAHPDYDAITRAGRCRLILTTPGLFTGGWRPTGACTTSDGLRFDLHGVTGRIVCAAVPRAEVVSGFDLARRRPKPAQRVAPAGSVYWLDDLKADTQTLRELVNRGLWSETVENDARRAEGFNRFTFAE